MPPEGYTPLTKCFQLALENNRQELNERKLLVLIFTDGSPTSQQTKDPIREFKHALKYRQRINRIFVTIIACTDDEYALKYLKDWDNKKKNLDVHFEAFSFK